MMRSAESNFKEETARTVEPDDQQNMTRWHVQEYNYSRNIHKTTSTNEAKSEEESTREYRDTSVSAFTSLPPLIPNRPTVIDRIVVCESKPC